MREPLPQEASKENVGCMTDQSGAIWSRGSGPLADRS